MWTNKQSPLHLLCLEAARLLIKQLINCSPSCGSSVLGIKVWILSDEEISIGAQRWRKKRKKKKIPKSPYDCRTRLKYESTYRKWGYFQIHTFIWCEKSMWRGFKWEWLFPGTIVWRYASFPKRPRINHANTAARRGSWISNMHADKHTCSGRTSHDTRIQILRTPS